MTRGPPHHSWPPMLERLSGAYALLQVSEDKQIVSELRGTVVGVPTAIIASLSAVFSVLFFAQAFGWLEFSTFESVSTRVQLNTSIGLAVFAFTTASASFFQRGAASLNVARFLTLLLSLVVVNYLPAAILNYAFPQLLWLPILFAAATVSGRWAAATVVITFAGVAYRFPDAPAFRNPASLCVTVGVLSLVLALRWLLDGRDANRDRLARLRGAGIGLSLDDFGTGYASLAQLHAFEIDIVKIDRRFVSGLAEGNREQALCAGIISLAHSLGMKVTAEGVETIEQRDLLVGLGCDYAQGWLFGRPVDAAAFEARLNGGG